MTTEVFRKIDFEAALKDALTRAKLDASKLAVLGLVDGEYQYLAEVNSDCFIHVNSSVGRDQLAMESGKNSIRMWFVGPDGMPLGHKFDKWTSREKGWQERVAKKINTMALVGAKLSRCPKCRLPRKVFQVRKETSKNFGRWFIRCECSGWDAAIWLDGLDDLPDGNTGEASPAPAQSVVQPGQEAATTPGCPDCGAPMVKRGRNPFWACSRYPACDGAMDYFEYTPGMDVTETAAWKRMEIAHKRSGRPIKYPEPISKPEPKVEAKVEAKANVEKPKAKAKAKTDVNLDALKAKAVASGVVVQQKGFKASSQQQAVMDWIDETNNRDGQDIDSLVVESGPGSGKTTTSVQALTHIPVEQRVVFVAFNTHIADELKNRVPRNVRATTWHKLGLAACYRAYGNDIVIDSNGNKLRGIMERLLDKKTHRHLYPTIKRLVSLVKGTLAGTDDISLDNLSKRHSLDFDLDDRELIFQTVRRAIDLCAQNTTVIDFDDMVWLPVYHRLPVNQFDVLVIDEAQDTNRCQLALAMMSVRANGRIIAVGDRGQSLYGFRGADTQAIPMLISTLNAKVLPLTITYRNPKKVVAYIQSRFPDRSIQAADWAIDGNIQTLHVAAAENQWQDGDMVLCRTNAPLVTEALRLISRGKKAVVRGRDIGDGLVALMEKMVATDVYDLCIKLADYRVAETAKLVAAEKESQAQSLNDNIDCLIALSGGVSALYDLEAKINSIFSDAIEGILFSSVHRAKGLEAKRVSILRMDLIPHPMAKQPWELEQEANVEWVALSRTLDELWFVEE